MTMAFSIYIMALLAFITFGTTIALEDLGGIPPAPMENTGVALGIPAAFAVIASLAAWFF